MKEITVTELKNKISEKEEFFLLDIREEFEREEFHIGGEFIPLAEVPQSVSKIPTDLPVIIYCKSGRRSAGLIEYLENQHNFENLYNLKGGITEWLNHSNPRS